ncbi:hypothetical protein P4576_15100 [Peribacillus frigoritolerans]|uniref:hypothetical protein n=1 Tax=Peribacillus frigoritolerans TaxID=450367 RepID=UPI002E1F0214|nr:hypothetical protein [Peribacillus frigoritolerans]
MSRKWKQKKQNQKESEFFMSVKTVRTTERSTILTIKRRREKRESDYGIPFFYSKAVGSKCSCQFDCIKL